MVVGKRDNERLRERERERERERVSRRKSGKRKIQAINNPIMYIVHVHVYYV